MQMNDKNEINQHQISTMAPQTVRVQVYGPEVIVRPLDKLLSKDVNMEKFNIEPGHSCASCS